MNFTLFQTISDTIMTPIITAMTGMMGPMSAAMQPIALGAIGIWLCFAVWDVQSGEKTLAMIGRQAFQIVMFYSLIWIGPYTTYVANLFLHTLPDTISVALGGNGPPMAMLDTLCMDSLRQAVTVYQAIPGYSLKGAFLSIGVILFVLAALVCVAFMFFVIAVAGLITVLVLAVGAVFLAAATVPWTRRLTSGWFAVLVGGVVTQLLGLALIRLLIGSSAAMMTQLTQTAAATDSNSIMMLAGLGELGILLWLFKYTMQRVPELAQIIGGGVYMGSQAAFAALAMSSTLASVMLGAATGAAGGAVRGAMATGTASGATAAAASGAMSGAGRAAASGFRYAAPAGRSLSRRTR